MPITKVLIKRSSIEGKKWTAEVYTGDKREKTVHFGQAGASDYTKHKDSERMKRYLERHSNERQKGFWRHAQVNLKRASYWSRWLLWNKPSLQGSLATIRSAHPSITFTIQ